MMPHSLATLRSSALVITLFAFVSLPSATPLGCLAAMVALTALPQAAHAEKREAESATVLKRARLRSAPSLNSANIMLLESGVVVEILSEQPPFVEVKLPSGKVGWVARRLLNLPKPPPLPIAPVSPLKAAEPVPAVASALPLPLQPEPQHESSKSWMGTLLALVVGILLGFGMGFYWRGRHLRRRFYSLRV